MLNYIGIFGMYEVRSGSKYEVYNNITENLYEWKEYNTSLRMNTHGLLEIALDLQDVTF